SIRRLSDGSFVTDLRLRFKRGSAVGKFLAIATLIGVGVGTILFPPVAFAEWTFVVIMGGLAVATLAHELRNDAAPRLQLQTVEADAAASTDIVVSDTPPSQPASAPARPEIVSLDVFMNGSDEANNAFMASVLALPDVR
ncbi:hypothetical protein AB4Z22_44905, partial [Paenibacillus sp. TAF58]